jgi:glutamine synthetase
MNPYLATAAIAAAGLDGIDNKIDPGEPLNLNLYDLTLEQIRKRGIGLLPQSLSEALDAFDRDDVVKAGIGAELSAEFSRVKRMEWVEFSRHVTQWESQRYLEMF